MADKLIKVGLGDCAEGAANLHDNSPAYREMESGKGWIRGTRAQLLECLYYLDSCPANFGDGADMTERSAVRRTIKAWRKALGLGEHDAIPVPESARKR